LAIRNLSSELERIAGDRKIKTSVFLLHKISFAKRRYLQQNPADAEEVDALTSGMKIKSLAALREEINSKISKYREEKKEAERKIVELTAQKIMRGSVVFLYGDSPLVSKALKIANSRGINFYVYTADSGPSFDGRKAAEEISSAKIPVKHFPDILLPEALSKADILFFEPEAVTKEGKIIASAGINNILSEAKKRKVFSYCVFNKGDAKRSAETANQYETKNNAIFVKAGKEEAALSGITAVINEYGIIKPSDFSRIL